MQLKVEICSPLARPNEYYDVQKLFEIAKKHLNESSAPIGQFKQYVLDPCWDDPDQPIDPFTAVFIQKLPEHVRRVEQADTGVALLMFSDGSLADGYHRLIKAMMEGHTLIYFMKFDTWEQIRSARFEIGEEK